MYTLLSVHYNDTACYYVEYKLKKEVKEKKWSKITFIDQYVVSPWLMLATDKLQQGSWWPAPNSEQWHAVACTAVYACSSVHVRVNMHLRNAQKCRQQRSRGRKLELWLCGGGNLTRFSHCVTSSRVVCYVCLGVSFAADVTDTWPTVWLWHFKGWAGYNGDFGCQQNCRGSPWKVLHFAWHFVNVC